MVSCSVMLKMWEYDFLFYIPCRCTIELCMGLIVFAWLAYLILLNCKFSVSWSDWKDVNLNEGICKYIN